MLINLTAVLMENKHSRIARITPKPAPPKVTVGVGVEGRKLALADVDTESEDRDSPGVAVPLGRTSRP